MDQKLDDMDRETRFQVPEGYFDELPMRIQQRIDAEKPRKWSFPLPLWSYATAAVLLIIASFALLMDQHASEVDELLAEVSEEDLVAYIEELDLDAFDLASTFPEVTNDLEFEDLEMMNNLDLEDHPIDDILLEFNLELDDIVI